MLDTDTDADADIDEMQWKIAGLSECCGGIVSSRWKQQEGYTYGVYLEVMDCSKCNKIKTQTGAMFIDMEASAAPTYVSDADMKRWGTDDPDGQ
jgi:hypothetical protein